MSQVIDKKLFAAIDKLNDQQKKEVLIFVGHISEEEKAGEKQYDKWEDDDFLTEMERRHDYYMSGGKMVTAEESKERINKLFEKSKK